MLGWSCFPSSPQVWGSLQQDKGKWHQQDPNKAELKRDVSSQSPERKFREQRGFFSVSTCCVCLSPSADWRQGCSQGKGRRWNCSDQTPFSLRSHRSCTGRSHAIITDEKGLIKNCGLMEKCDLIFQEHYSPSFCLPACMRKSKSL